MESLNGGEYEVFLNFCGRDTRQGFTYSLYKSLENGGVHTFMDDEKLLGGEKIEQLLEAIEQSKIFVPIFSKNYASREWCLKELAKAVECNQSLKILPIFYDVEPSIVREHSKTYEEAFLIHEKNHDKGTIQNWKKALTEVSSLKGWELQKGYRGYHQEVIKEVVSKICKDLEKTKLVVPDNIERMYRDEREIMGHLDMDAKDTRILVIQGKPCSGKTTLAKCIYNDICDRFGRNCSFLANIREKSSQVHGLESLQKQLIHDLSEGQGPANIPHVDRGINIISQRFHNKKVLILLDDIDKKEHLDALAKEVAWFGLGSRIIVTTRVGEISNAPQVHSSYLVTYPQKDYTPFLLKPTVGPLIQNATRKALDNLIKDGVRVIGIYGVGGVGKTTLALHIHDHLLQRRSNFKEVHWVTVSKDCDTFHLQGKISRAFNVDLSDLSEKARRSATLSKELKNRENVVLFLDDVWDPIPLESFGISTETKSCSVIVTSRSFEVCTRMSCETSIRVDTLGKNEAWELFSNHLGRDINLTKDIKEIAHDLVNECAGLPLAIVVMGSCMRAVEDIEEWRDTLQKLKLSKEGHIGMDSEVFPVLKLSYDHLRNRQVQECFLYCAVYPEDFWIPAVELFYRLIDVGLIKEGTRKEELNRGRYIINQLERASLLERRHENNKIDVKMHDLIRDMALRIKSSKFMVKAGLTVDQIPEEEEWTNDDSQLSIGHGEENKNLEVVSFIGHDISDISISPACPNLLILLLNGCRTEAPLRRVSNCFFERLLGLKVLDLSMTRIEELPSSIGELVKLTALVLRHCRHLKVLPSLEKLTTLKTLDLFRTAIKQNPVGLEKLVNLKYLSLYSFKKLKLPVGILSKLSHLRHLVTYGPIGEELKSLKQLQILRVWFINWVDYKTFLMSYFSSTMKVTSFLICVGDALVEDVLGGYRDEDDLELPDRGVKMWGLCSRDIETEDFLPFPKDTSTLYIERVRHAKSLSITNSINLESCYIDYCYNLESAISSPFSGGLRTMLSSSSSSHNIHVFTHLRFLKIQFCDRMKRVFDLGFSPELPKLESLDVLFCEQIEEIIAATPDNNKNISILPKLRNLTLFYLPNLKSISPTLWVCDSLEALEIAICPTLKKLPLSLRMVNGKLCPPSALHSITLGFVACHSEEGRLAHEAKSRFSEVKQWWQSLEWDDPNAERVLRPFARLNYEKKVGRKLSEELKDAISPDRNGKRLKLN